MCSASQFHFERVDPKVEPYGGYRLSHPQIDWQLYREWTTPPTNVALALARDVAKSLAVATKAGEWALPSQIIHRMGTFTRLSDPTEQNLGTRDQALAELYRKQRTLLSRTECISTLHRWLAIMFAHPTLREELDPDPIEETILLASEPPLPAEVHPSLAGWIWRLGELTELQDRRAALRSAAETILFDAAERQGSGRTLAVIAGRSSDRIAANDLCLRWLQKNFHLGQAYHVIRVIYDVYPREVFALGSDWVGRYLTNKEAPKILLLLAKLRPDDDELITLGLRWLLDNPAHANYETMLAALVASRPKRMDIATLAFNWIERNPLKRTSHVMLGPLLAANPDNEVIVAKSLNWLQNNPDSSHVMLGPQLAASPDNEMIVVKSLNWLRNYPDSMHSPSLLGALIKAQPLDHRVAEFAAQWLDGNVDHPNVHIVLKNLIIHCRTAQWLEEGRKFFAREKYGAGRDNVHRQEILIALIAGSSAAGVYIEYMLDEIQSETDAGRKNNLLIQLSRALANNVTNSLQFLATSTNEDDKRRAAKSLSYGLGKFPKRAREFLSQLDAAPIDFAGFLLAACIRSKLSDESLTGPLVTWLNGHRRGKGYGMVLNALKERRYRWQEILKDGRIGADVISDYNNFASRY